ncbi:MAG TPA: adenylate/guanylate cyclase domain-containing protein [Acidimicrobiales bacterium]|nr:adenylate/guanylate cyclase domain-containing protein [Acidimicrobiales bacterium]
MQTCVGCGRENSPDARCCDRCGASLATEAATPEQLKTITVLFADVTGSTALGERLEAETLRRVLERYFELARRVIERHGGTVEKFIGDAVMAVFGVPVLHEDDALRAVRAAADLRAELPELNRELERDFDTTLQLRTGVNTGEAVTATDEWLALGDAVNVAARLEQVASPGEVLLGEATLRLVRDAVVVEELEPMELRGKSNPLPAYRLIEVIPDASAPRRHLDTPMVGRTHQLRMLEDALANVTREHTCSLFTLLGVAGVGKSRLAAEFLGKLDVTVLRGRCLSYGEGITYWPVVEVVKQLLETQADSSDGGQKLMGSAEESAAIGALLGQPAVTSTSVEIAWAVRKLLERAANPGPLVVVFDDIHWGEQTFFDLVEQMTDLSRDAPILLLCMARPELLERRPTWGGGKLNATTVLLEPLNSDEAGELIEQLLPHDDQTDTALRARVLDAAAGNPLFLEEIAAVVATSGGAVSVPPTIQALLAARLDQLEPGERRVLERGSVEGKSFHRGAVQALGPDEAGVPATLVTLVRKDLVRPDHATVPGDDAFRFRHLLIRDAAYESLPKSVRAQLHERFAYWLDERAGDLTERDEIVGYHLEQAYRYRRDLGPVDAASQAVAAAAAERLETAGRRALDREDASAAVNLLERASSLVPSDRPEIPLELSVVWALFQLGRPADAVVRAEATSARAAAIGDVTGELRAELARLTALSHVDPGGPLTELGALVQHARPLLEQAGEDAALTSLWHATWVLEHNQCRFGAAAEAALRAVEHGTRAGEHYMARYCRMLASSGIGMGPMPVAEALTWLQQASANSQPPEPWIDVWWAEMLSLIGRFDEARSLHNAAIERMAERGSQLGLALASGWVIETEAGDHSRAEEVARRACQRLEDMGERSFWSTKACELAQSLYSLGRYDESESWARHGAEVGDKDDVATQLLSRQVLAKVEARRGHFDDARRLADEALAIAEGMDAPHHRGNAALDAAEVLWLAGDRAGAVEQAKSAAAHFAEKGATASVARALRFAEMVEGWT